MGFYFLWLVTLFFFGYLIYLGSFLFWIFNPLGLFLFWPTRALNLLYISATFFTYVTAKSNIHLLLHSIAGLLQTSTPTTVASSAIRRRSLCSSCFTPASSLSLTTPSSHQISFFLYFSDILRLSNENGEIFKLLYIKIYRPFNCETTRRFPEYRTTLNGETKK